MKKVNETKKVPKVRHSVFGDFYTNTKGLSSQEKQVLVRDIEQRNKSKVETGEHPRREGTKDLIASVLWFVSAIVSALVGHSLLMSLGILGGIIFLFRGLIKRYTG